MIRLEPSLTWGLLAVAAWGCTGQLGGPAGEGAGDSGTPDPTTFTASVSEIRRLGKLELSNTVRDLLPQLSALEPGADLPDDNSVEMAFALPGSVSEIEVKRFMDMAEEMVTALGAGSPARSLACSSDESSCARAFIQDFTRRAFRRPADAVEVDDLMALYDKLRSDPEMAFAFDEALEVVIEAVLQSPGFLYRWERGLKAPQMDGELVKYDDYEMASRLSYFLWNSMPDEALLGAAAEARLSTPEQIEAQVRRMVADPRMDATLADFVTQWLELKGLSSIVKDSNVYPSFTPDLGQAMWNEAAAFGQAVFRSPRSNFTELLTGSTSFVSPELAQFYGVSADASGQVDLSSGSRRGVLTLGGLLAAKGNSYRTSPVRRGKFVLNRLLCETIPPPPPDAEAQLPAPDPTLTQREQMAQHRADPVCASCHVQMDALGFAFESFDGAGGYRETEAGLPLDTTGEVVLDGARVAFENAAELIDALVASPQVHGCFARQWLRYALDRFEQREEASAVTALVQAHEQSGLDLTELIVEIARSKPFSHRALLATEVSP